MKTLMAGWSALPL